MSLTVRLIIKKKPVVLDVEGKTISKSLIEMGFDEVVDCRKGSFIDIEINQKLLNKYSSDLDLAVKEFIASSCKKLLVNEIIDTYEYSIIKK